MARDEHDMSGPNRSLSTANAREQAPSAVGAEPGTGRTTARLFAGVGPEPVMEPEEKAPRFPEDRQESGVVVSPNAKASNGAVLDKSARQSVFQLREFTIPPSVAAERAQEIQRQAQRAARDLAGEVL